VGQIERLNITLPADMAGVVKDAVDQGDYDSASEVILEALQDWKLKRESLLQRLTELKAEMENGMADVKAGKVSKFNLEEIAALGKKLHSGRRQVQKLPDLKKA
jgi:antitoxin ParD1/3/4